MSFDFEGKSVLVSGASRGIGRAIATDFRSKGAKVYAGVRSRDYFDELLSAGMQPVILDVTSSENFSQVINDICTADGSLHALINNAGVAGNTPAAALKENEINQLIDTNFKGTFHGMQAYYKAQRKNGGIIINIASILGLVGTPLASVYCGTKGAVIQMTKALAVEWAGSGFRVNAIAPGFIDTDMTDMMKKRDSVMKAVLQNIPLKRLGQPTDISGAALFLASDYASYMTGQVVVVDGGLTAH